MLTIITPVYNRAQLVRKAFDSLCAQSVTDFEWIVVDDGSTDAISETVNGFAACPFTVKFLVKENGGKHTALNEGIKLASGELTLILDSDDALTQDAVETILRDWDGLRDKKELCGLSYLRGRKDGSVIGKEFPRSPFKASYIECRVNQNIWGDKAEVFLTELLRQNPFPVFEGERFLGESVIWSRLGKSYDTVHINKAIYICEYLEGGLSQSGRALRIKCPLGGMAYALEHIDKRVRLKVRLKMLLLYLTYARFAGLSYKQAKQRLPICKGWAAALWPASRMLYRKWSKLL